MKKQTQIEIDKFINLVLSKTHIPQACKDDICEEISNHLETSMETFMQLGFSEEMALARAISEFGSEDAISRDLRRWNYLHWLRTLLNNPIWSRKLSLKYVLFTYYIFTYLIAAVELIFMTTLTNHERHYIYFAIISVSVIALIHLVVDVWKVTKSRVLR
ncbi:MAG: permease prefix domain 1-containing protein [Acidobacteriota bacterium]